MIFSLTNATPDDAVIIADLRNKVADHLTATYGKGHWSYQTSSKSVLNGMTATSKILIAKNGSTIVGTLRLVTKKPWSMDPAYFTKVDKPLYLINMLLIIIFNIRALVDSCCRK